MHVHKYIANPRIVMTLFQYANCFCFIWLCARCQDTSYVDNIDWSRCRFVVSSAATTALCHMREITLPWTQATVCIYACVKLCIYPTMPLHVHSNHICCKEIWCILHIYLTIIYIIYYNIVYHKPDRMAQLGRVRASFPCGWSWAWTPFKSNPWLANIYINCYLAWYSAIIGLTNGLVWSVSDCYEWVQHQNMVLLDWYPTEAAL